MKKAAMKKPGAVHLTINSLKQLISKGYKFVQIKGLTWDMHFEYVEPHFLVLVPIKSLPKDQAKKDIYEPLNSKLLRQWATEKDDATEIIISAGIL